MSVTLTERKTTDSLRHEPFSPELAISKIQMVTFPDGIPGFETLKHYLLGEVRDYPPFMLMISEEDKTISLLLLSVEYVYRYNRKLRSLYKKYCGVYTNGQAEHFDTYLVLHCDHDPETITANLKAPIMIENRKRIGKQLILDTEELSCHYPLKTKVG